MSEDDGKSSAVASTYRPEFVEALQLLAQAFEEVVRARYERPILVGGAAVEFLTGGALVSGDFDVVTLAQGRLEEALISRGFVRPSGPGELLRGLKHPTLGIGVEVVSGLLFDGAADRTRVRLINTGTGNVAIPAVEDMIADRLGQYCANPRGHVEMLEQAIILYEVATGSLESRLDETYLNTRILQETFGTHDLRFLIEQCHGSSSHP